MDCPHLAKQIRHPHRLTGGGLDDNHNDLADAVRAGCPCKACGTTDSPWMCVRCGYIGCGRYVNAHAKDHYGRERPGHCVCIECNELSVFCYLCDEFVINDLAELDSLRSWLRTTREQPVGAGLAGSLVGVGGTTRQLRRRHSNELDARRWKRARNGQLSGENDLHENVATGLKNLGNTCFMNAVLQSLANLPMFMKEIAALPTFTDQLRLRSCSADFLRLLVYRKQPNSSSPSSLTTSPSSRPRRSRVRSSSSTSSSSLSPTSLPAPSSAKLAGGQWPASSQPSVRRRRPNHQIAGDEDAERPMLLVDELAKILKGLDEAEVGDHRNRSLTPTDLFYVVRTVVPRFGGYQQQDAHEFMCYLLDRVSVELRTLRQFSGADSGDFQLTTPVGSHQRQTLVQRVFGGQLYSEVTCLTCGAKSTKVDPYTHLSLDIPDRMHGHSKSAVVGSSAVAASTAPSVAASPAVAASNNKTKRSRKKSARSSRNRPTSNELDNSTSENKKNKDNETLSPELEEFNSAGQTLQPQRQHQNDGGGDDGDVVDGIGDDNDGGGGDDDVDDDDETLHLKDCLQSFTRIEHLASSELWTCPNCATKQPSTKRMYVRKLPSVLCLHLKRFRWSCNARHKVNTWVEFPLRDLDMSPLLVPRWQLSAPTRRSSELSCPVYDLAAVIVHHGTGVSSGHYTAFTHLAQLDQWRLFDDAKVSVANEPQVAGSTAYMLFYVRK